MSISGLVQQHGVGILVGCNQPGYPPFQVLEKLGDRRFRVRYPDGKEAIIDDCLSDYELG